MTSEMYANSSQVSLPSGSQSEKEGFHLNLSDIPEPSLEVITYL